MAVQGRFSEVSQPVSGSADASRSKEIAKHTPGPWVSGWYRHGNQDQGFDLYGKDNRTVARIPVIGDTRELQEANARLIAAAPELLAALIAVTELLEGFREHPIDQDLDDDEAPIIAPALDAARATGAA